MIAAAREKDDIVAGAIFNGDADVVGVSNVFGVTPWPGVVSFAHRQFAGATIVGYESGAALVAAQDAGFAVAGPLRVWVR